MGNVHDAADHLFKPFAAELAALGYESAERQRVKWIEEDLKSLGRSFQSTSSSAIENLDVTSLADCLGAIYVLEGSTLGGQIIASAVARTLSLTPPDRVQVLHWLRSRDWAQMEGQPRYH